MALTNPCFKDQFCLKLEEEPYGRRRREEEKEEEMKPRSRGMELWIFGMETTLIMKLNGSMEL